MESEDRHKVISHEIHCCSCSSKVKSIMLYLRRILPFLPKGKKSDWHTSAAKADRHHSLLIH